MKQNTANPRILFILTAVMFGLMVVLAVSLLMTVLFTSPKYTYTAFIKQQLCVSCIPLIVLGLLFSLFGLIFFKKTDSDVVSNWMVVVWFVFVLVLAVYIASTMSGHYMDMKKADHITYTGSFEKDHTRDFIFLDDENTTRLNNRNETFLEPGYYSGTIVYSKRCKYVLSYSLDSGEKVLDVVDQW